MGDELPPLEPSAEVESEIIEEEGASLLPPKWGATSVPFTRRSSPSRMTSTPISRSESERAASCCFRKSKPA